MINYLQGLVHVTSRRRANKERHRSNYLRYLWRRLQAIRRGQKTFDEGTFALEVLKNYPIQGSCPCGEPNCSCMHEANEGCMTCRGCGECREDLDAAELCTDCGGLDEDNLPCRECGECREHRDSDGLCDECRVDESVCICGHLDSEHDDRDLRAGLLAWACGQCPCDKFETREDVEGVEA